MEKDKKMIIEKIKKLLALSKSSNEHEAALAAAHAQRLLSEHNLAMTDVEAGREAGAAEKVETDSAKTLPKWVWRLLGGVQAAFDCQVVHKGIGKIVFIGVGADAQVASYTFTYLDKTIRRLCREYMKSIAARRETMNVSDVAMVRNSYYLGVANAVCKTILAQKEKTPVTPGALVPVKQALIKKAMSELGEVKEIRSRKSFVDSDAYQQGQRDGRDIALHRGVGNDGAAPRAAIGM